ncbi:MAG: type I-B CRISPR-associated protein Cas8b/Csh1 [Bacteroidales bacterium]|nr:type I-B CRISPR-associated protein Cas8b/Csh1 [Bacteroidales bacterium]MCF8337288.1 type I-B CRISPR-associated protein Cas8b/Csh1 [Bacteroidales bacterium]
MHDRAIAAIGKWQLKKLREQNLEKVDMYIQNMFPGQDYQVLVLIFEINENSCIYKGIDIEKVTSERTEFRKYAYRKGSSRGGDITFTTKLSKPQKKENEKTSIEKKIETVKNNTFKNLLIFKNDYPEEGRIFEMVRDCIKDNETKIKDDLNDVFESFDNQQAQSTGLTFKIKEKGIDKYLRDYEIIKKLILSVGESTKYTHVGIKSKAKSRICSVTGKQEPEIFGFAAPFKYSTADKPGFLSGFFNLKNNWKNYPISPDEAFNLELGGRFIKEHLKGYFYVSEYLIVPHPILKTDIGQLGKIINLLKSAFDEERKARNEKRKRAEDRVQKLIAQEKNYFNLDMLFFTEDKKTGSISIHMMIEEILPSRFRTLFIDVPEIINQRTLFKNAIQYNKELSDLKFSFQLVKDFFGDDFLDMVHKLFTGKKISEDYVFEHIIKTIRKNYIERKTTENFVEYTDLTVKKAIMLLTYLQYLTIINYNKNYTYMEAETNEKKEGRFDAEGFNEFILSNNNFLDSDIKVGIFAVGVLVRFLFDIQSQSLGTKHPPFENKLRGYKINPELLMNAYTEALDKIQKYQKNFYVYTDLRNIINRYFIPNSNQLSQMTNNELSFYFVAGLELGKQFKNERISETNE